jgi:hypothetical protein
MDLQKWVEPLFTYGPYAAAVLFLSVALYLLKVWRQVRAKDRVQVFVYAGYTLASWAVVIIAVQYIYRNWPPTTVYAGSLGVYDSETVKFFSQSGQLFVRSTPTSDGRLRWDYVVIIRQPADHGEFEFTYQWGTAKEQYGDYKLELVQLTQGRTKVTYDPNQPGKLFYDGNDQAVPKQPLQVAGAARLPRPAGLAAMLITAAHAQERPRTDVLIKWLDSPDANLRAQARAQLRELPPADLKRLQDSPGLSDFARKQIEGQMRTR